jgi:hypothetical protein
VNNKIKKKLVRIGPFFLFFSEITEIVLLPVFVLVGLIRIIYLSLDSCAQFELSKDLIG